MVQAVIASIVVCFTQEHENESKNHARRVYIRHVQSKEAVNFTHIQEALDLLSQVAELGDA